MSKHPDRYDKGRVVFIGMAVFLVVFWGAIIILVAR